jgi:Lrp/AsnC family leucine-responsive transcriptional regulator
MDSIGLKILKILQEKARIPNVEVARKVGLAPSAVLERIRKLEKTGVIDGYEVRLNPQRFNRDLVAFVLVRIVQGGDDQRLGQTLAAIADVQEVHFIAGDDAYLVKLRVADTAGLNHVVRHCIAVIPEVAATRTSVVLNTIKESSKIPLT